MAKSCAFDVKADRIERKSGEGDPALRKSKSGGNRSGSDDRADQATTHASRERLHGEGVGGSTIDGEVH